MIKKQEIKIISNIVQEISLFLMMHGYKEYQLEVKSEHSVTSIIISISPPKHDLIDRMKEKITGSREIEIETYGWELLGDIDTRGELLMIGALIDDMIVEEFSNTTRITLHRKNIYKD